VESQPDGKAQLGYFGALAYIHAGGQPVCSASRDRAANRLAYFNRHDLRAFLRLGALDGGGGGDRRGSDCGRVRCSALDLEHAVHAGLCPFRDGEFFIIVGAQCLALLTNVFGNVTTQMRLFWMQCRCSWSRWRPRWSPRCC